MELALQSTLRRPKGGQTTPCSVALRLMGFRSPNSSTLKVLGFTYDLDDSALANRRKRSEAHADRLKKVAHTLRALPMPTQSKGREPCLPWFLPRSGRTRVWLGSRIEPRIRQVRGRTWSMSARLHANFGEVRRSLANPQRHLHENLFDIHQSSREGPPTFTRVPAKVPSVCGWPSECLHVKIKGVIFSTLIAEVRSPVPYSPLHPPTSSLPGECSQAHRPAPSSLPPRTLMDANRPK